MFNSTTLEVAIGMALVYLLLSLFCTAINEGIAGILGSRAKNLEEGIKSLFTEGLKTSERKEGDKVLVREVTLAQAIYDHGLVQSLYKSGAGLALGEHVKNPPSYIPSRTFASALFDIVFPDIVTPPAVTTPLTAGGAGQTAPTAPSASGTLPNLLPNMLKQLEALPESKGKEAIVTLVKQANGDITETRQAFERWYDDGMDRAAGWYKRKTQLVLFFLGLIIAIALNVDSIAVGRALWTVPALRSYTVEAAQAYAKDHPLQSTIPDPSKTPIANASRVTPADDLSVLQSLALPVGWNSSKLPWMDRKQDAIGNYTQSFSIVALLFALTGWFLTAIAMTLGAPFWFDTLNQFMVVRSTIKPREKSEVEGSKDSKK